MLSGQRKFSFLSLNFCWERHVVQTLDTISANAGGDNCSTSTKSFVNTFKTDFVDKFPLSEEDDMNGCQSI